MAESSSGAAALHLAVRFRSAATVRLLLSHRSISPNGIHPPGSGTTPLHLAASLGHVHIVKLLLEREDIDDTLRDSQGKTCRDVARTKEVRLAIDDSRSSLNTSYRDILRSYILSPLSSPLSSSLSRNLIRLLESPRVVFLDLSYLDADSGTSLLHEAARRRHLRLVELAVLAGADILIRDPQAIAKGIEWYKMREAMPPFIFTGDNDLHDWLAELNDYFSRNNLQEAEKLPTAIKYLSVDVQNAIMRVQDVLQQIIAQEPTMDSWHWSYSRLEGALKEMQKQIEEYRTKAEKARTEAILKECAIAAGSIATALALPAFVASAVGLVGFGATGVAGGSAAAAMQSTIGVIQAGSAFAFCQSLGAGGAAMGTVVGASAAASSVGAGAASVANVKAWLDGQNEMPSYSWADGKRFVPSPELLLSLLKL